MGRRGGGGTGRQGQGVERDRPEGGRWAVGRGWLEGRPRRRGLPAQGELLGLYSHALH